MQVKTHAFEELEKVVLMLRKTIKDSKQGLAVVSANYGVGKTQAAKMLTKHTHIKNNNKTGGFQVEK